MLKNIFKHKNQKGFTMIELLVVMMIIGVLAGLSLFSLQGARRQGRDGKRKADLEAIRAALELYKADCNVYPPPGAYPAVDSPLTGNCTGSVNTYITKRPGDPSGTTFGVYAYRPLPAGGPYTTYTLCSTLEDPPSPANDTSNCGSCAPATCGYKVTSP